MNLPSLSRAHGASNAPRVKRLRLQQNNTMGSPPSTTAHRPNPRSRGMMCRRHSCLIDRTKLSACVQARAPRRQAQHPYPRGLQQVAEARRVDGIAIDDQVVLTTFLVQVRSCGAPVVVVQTSLSRARRRCGRGMSPDPRAWRGKQEGECRLARAAWRRCNPIDVALHTRAERHASASMSLRIHARSNIPALACRSTRS